MAESSEHETNRPATNVPTVPHHGGTPSEMLRDLARFLDGLEAITDKVAFTTGPHEGKTLAEALTDHRANNNTVQTDVRWLADWLEQNLAI